jgi:hypothetical protein
MSRQLFAEYHPPLAEVNVMSLLAQIVGNLPHWA